MNWTEIILGLFTLLSTCGWLTFLRPFGSKRAELERGLPP